jgi:hypothetical protein
VIADSNATVNGEVEMISSDIASKIVLQTVAETDLTLNHWTQRLARRRNLELGGDPSFVSELEDDLRRLARKVKSLSVHFDLPHVPLGQAQYYYDTAEQLDDILTLIHAIRQKSFGSRRNTEECLMRLTNCSETVHHLNSSALPDSLIRH